MNHKITYNSFLSSSQPVIDHLLYLYGTFYSFEINRIGFSFIGFAIVVFFFQIKADVNTKPHSKY